MAVPGLVFTILGLALASLPSGKYSLSVAMIHPWVTWLASYTLSSHIGILGGGGSPCDCSPWHPHQTAGYHQSRPLVQGSPQNPCWVSGYWQRFHYLTLCLADKTSHSRTIIGRGYEITPEKRKEIVFPLISSKSYLAVKYCISLYRSCSGHRPAHLDRLVQWQHSVLEGVGVWSA